MIPKLLMAAIQKKCFGGQQEPSARNRWWIGSVTILVTVAGLWLLDRSTFNFIAQAQAWVEGIGPGDGLWALMGGAVFYALLLSVPFVPGVELGLALMMIFGVSGVAMAYLGTILGLGLAYGLGHWIAPDFIVRRLESKSGVLKPVTAISSALEGRSRLLRRLGVIMKRHPHLLLALLLNLPGNSLLGGGGGIGMLFGLTRPLSWPAYLLTVSVATAPVPLLFLMGWSVF